jgi:hypothetical protein
MRREEGEKTVTVETAKEGKYFSELVSRRLGRELRKHAVFIDMFIYAEDELNDEKEYNQKWTEMPLSEKDSETVFNALRAETRIGGEGVEDSKRRLVAFSCLAKLDLLGVESFAAIE